MYDLDLKEICFELTRQSPRRGVCEMQLVS